MRKPLPPAHEWIKFLQGEVIEGEIRVMVSEKTQGKWKKPREGLCIFTNFRILFVPLRIVASTVSLLCPPSPSRSSSSSSSSSSPPRSSSPILLDAADVKQGLYGSFCPIIRRFPEENRGIEDEDLADLVDLGAEMSQDGPPSWVKMTLKDKIEKKDNIAHLAPLQWVEGPSRRKGGKRSKKESGFKPVGRGLPEVMEWTNKGVCDSNRILSIPFGMVYEIFVLYEQNSEERGLPWPRSLPDDLLYKTDGVIQLELRSFRSLQLVFLSSPKASPPLLASGGEDEKVKVPEAKENGKGATETTTEETKTESTEETEPTEAIEAPETEMSETETPETSEGTEMQETNEPISQPPPPERHSVPPPPSEAPQPQQGGSRWGGGWWSATVAVATNALALAGGTDATHNPSRQRRRYRNDASKKYQAKGPLEKGTKERGNPDGEMGEGSLGNSDGVTDYESCLSTLYQRVFLDEKGFSSLSCSPSLLPSPPEDKWTMFDIRQEFLRLGFYQSGHWRISDQNKGFALSETYPGKVITPAETTDATLQEVAKYRSKRRFPAVTWRNAGNGAILARCSQPLAGFFVKRNAEDELLIRQIRGSVKAEREDKEKKRNRAEKESQDKENEEGKTEEDESRGKENENENENEIEKEKEKENDGNVVKGSILREDTNWFHVSGDTEDEEDSDDEEDDDENEEAKKRGDMEIYDCRSQIAAVANSANGAGTENPVNYEGCSLSFLNIQNIHSVRSSLGMLRTLCSEQNVSEWRWCSSLEGTGWLCNIQSILAGSLSVAKTLHYGRSVLIHCSDGWDRTAQVSALAQLFMDPFFRSLEGFEVLVEKEWISFGHKFHDRLAPGKERYFEQNEACPVFQQWIECVWQVQRQFPDAFEYNERYLLFMVDAVLSRMFGNFSYNCEKERKAGGVQEKTQSVWHFTRANAKHFTNPNYNPLNEALFPAVEMWRLRLWGESFFRHYCWIETQDSH